MPLLLTIRVFFVTTVFLCTLICIADVHAAMDQRFVLDSQTIDSMKSTAKVRQGAKKRSSRDHVKQSLSTHDKGGVYTVKTGDHLFKIVMRDYNLSNDEAELFIEEIKRENNIYDIKRLKIGQKITIPPVRRSSDGSIIPLQTVRNNYSKSSGIIVEQSFNLKSPGTALSEQETVDRVHDMWNQIVPPTIEQQKPLEIKSAAFSLTLDPERYPTFARMNGGRLALDQNGSIPPLVKSLIEDKDASIRIVTEAPSGTKRFMASLLEAGGFYSVEENFSMVFGVDPKLTVRADFKVEKTAESIIKQDMVLMNSGRSSLPPALGKFLKKEGFSLFEPFASPKPFEANGSLTIYNISAKNQLETTDAILSACSVSPERDRRVDVFATDNNGISLSVKAQRYFERGGQRYVVTSFDGDPANYTLFRILETKGYNVVILQAQDDFRKISEKLISRMKIKGVFAHHNLIQDGSAEYSVQMSGFMLNDVLLPGGGVFLTDRAMDRIFKDVFTESGIIVNSR